MGKKISFDVEGVNIVDVRNDSQFAILEIDAFASGKNRHNMYVSRETLEKTSSTILSKPITWVYDKFFDDIGHHDDMQVPGGFVPSDSPIVYKELEDGRTMMTVLALIWKRYSGDLLSFFKRDGGKKGVSVEMEVFDAVEMPDGMVELKDFCYSAITCLGDMVTPAIPWAKASVIKFSNDYKQDYATEFSDKYSEINFTIPDVVKKNSIRGMDFYKQHGGAKSIALYNANYFIENSKINFSNVKNIYAYLEKYSDIPLEEQNPENTKYLNFMLSGGFEAMDWLRNILENIGEINSRKNSYQKEFVYKNLRDLNPALKGIDPPISLDQANQIAKVAEAIGSTEEKNGWAIAIGNFKKTHKVEDGKWVKNESKTKKENLNMTDEKEEGKEKEIFQEPEKEGVEEIEKEKEESPEEEKEEEKEEESKKKFSLDEYIDVTAALAFLEGETEDNVEVARMACDEMKKGEFADSGKIVAGMYAMMTKYAEKAKEFKEKFEKAEGEARAYMAENEELKKFKADVEAQKFQFEVEFTMKEVESTVKMPKDEFESLVEKSKEFSLETLDAWKNLVKARAFSYAKKDDKEETTVKYALPFTGKSKTKDSLWG